MHKNIDQVPGIVCELYSIVNKLEGLFPGRKFTLDGHLLGSIGEVIAASRYDIDLHQLSAPKHDAKTIENRQVQIKITQGNKIGLSKKPEFLIVLKINPQNGITEEIYNGPGDQIWRLTENRKRPENGQYQISLNTLKGFMAHIEDEDKISTRKTK